MAVVLHTTHGSLPVLLFYRDCPKASFNFLALCASGRYDNCCFYRHFPGVLLQTGDPTNSGKGGDSIFASTAVPTSSSGSLADPTASSTPAASAERPAGAPVGRFFDDEGFGVTHHGHRGVLAMAHKGAKPNTNASQFFILCSPQPTFDGVYTAFGVIDLEGGYDVKTGKLIGHPAATDAPLSDETQTGELVLSALESAAAQVDEKNMVISKDDIRITGATVLYNPFAEGRITL